MDSLIVSSHYEEDINWLKKIDFPVLVASKEGSSSVESNGYYSFNKVPNIAREAGSYLWYIVNYWDNLPKKIFFIHGHQRAYHQRVSLEDAVSKYINFDFYDFNHFYRYHWILNERQDLFLGLWEELLKKRFGSCPQRIVCDLCAQFVVDRDLIKQNPKELYEHIYSRLYGKYSNLGVRINYQIGAFFEIIWHILFGMPPLLEETNYPEGSLDPKPLSNFTFDVYIKNNRVYANKSFLRREFIEISPYIYEENSLALFQNYEKLFSVLGGKKVLGMGFSSLYRVCPTEPNAAYFIRNNIHIQALRDIKKDEEITIPSRKFIR